MKVRPRLFLYHLFFINITLCDTHATSTLVPKVFFCCEKRREERGERREERGERERSSKRKPLVAGDANLTIMLR